MKVSACTHRSILVPCSLQNFNYQVDPYIGCGHYCYYCYALNHAETDWSKEIRIHSGITGQLEEELETILPQNIYLSYYTDPYQPCEAEYRQTRRVLKLFLQKGFSARILTKSDLVVRDVDLLAEMADAAVSVSVAFNDNRIRQQFEGHTIDTGTRIEALRKLRAAGIETNALICPVIPYITHVTPLIDMLAPHTDTIWIYGLSIQSRSDQNWQNLVGILDQHFLDLKEKVEQVVFSNDHPYWTQIRQDLEQLQKDRPLKLIIHL
jgi:DNA repair photolyase